MGVVIILYCVLIFMLSAQMLKIASVIDPNNKREKVMPITFVVIGIVILVSQFFGYIPEGRKGHTETFGIYGKEYDTCGIIEKLPWEILIIDQEINNG